MATPTNRSPWVVSLPKTEAKSFRLESKAREYLASLGFPNSAQAPKGALKQLDTAFEAQITRKDKAGNRVKRQGTFDSYSEAEKWIKETEASLDKILKQHGGFSVGFESITFKEALTAFHKKHYAGKSSFNENEYRVLHLSEWIGEDKLLRDLTRRDMIALRDKLKKLNYSASSQRNYFTVLTSFYKYEQNELLYPVDNIAAGIKLPKPNNAIQRYWVGDEKDRLFKSLAIRSPWLIPIVELSLEMTFRRSELVKRPNTKSIEERKAEAKAAAEAAASRKPIEQTPEQKKADEARPEYLGGLKWENIDWERSSVTLTEEKNDGTKRATEYKGRTVPLTKRMREILTPLFDASPTKSGYVFEGTVHSVTGAFSNACKMAEPPITKLTFHSMRKVGTKDLAERVNNPMQLGKLSGHKNIDVLYRRYFEVTLDELARLLDDSDGTIAERGLRALTKALGADGAKKFLDGVRTMESLPAAS